MKKEILYSMKSPFRDDFKIIGYTFGEGKKSLAIVGAMRGDEVAQQGNNHSAEDRCRQQAPMVL